MDRTLVERAQRGDREAYEALARDAAPRLYRTAYRIVRDADRAEDAVQQTLVAIWRELPSLRDVDRFSAWTYRLVVRFCTAEARRNAKAGVRVHRRSTRQPWARRRDRRRRDPRPAGTRSPGAEPGAPDGRRPASLRRLPLGEIAEILGDPVRHGRVAPASRHPGAADEHRCRRPVAGRGRAAGMTALDRLRSHPRVRPGGRRPTDDRPARRGRGARLRSSHPAASAAHPRPGPPERGRAIARR